MKLITKEFAAFWTGLKSFLGDKPLVFATASLVFAWAIARDPSFTTQQANNLETIALVIAGGIVGGFKLEDVAQAVASRPTSLSAAIAAEIQAFLASLNSNTSAVNANTTVTASNTAITGATLGQKITDPPPSSLSETKNLVSDAHTPQPSHSPLPTDAPAGVG